MGQAQISTESDDEEVHKFKPDPLQPTLYAFGVKPKPKEDDVHKSIIEASTLQTVGNKILKRFKPLKENNKNKMLQKNNEMQTKIDKFVNRFSRPNKASEQTAIVSPLKTNSNFSRKHPNNISNELSTIIKLPAITNNESNNKNHNNTRTNSTPINKNTVKSPPKATTNFEPKFDEQIELSTNDKANLNTMIHNNMQFPAEINTSSSLINQNEPIVPSNKYEQHNETIGHNIETNMSIQNERCITADIPTIDLFPQKTLAHELKEDERLQKRKTNFLNGNEKNNKINEYARLKSVEKIKQMRTKSLVDSQTILDQSNYIEIYPSKKNFEKMIIEPELTNKNKNYNENDNKNKNENANKNRNEIQNNNGNDKKNENVKVENIKNSSYFKPFYRSARKFNQKKYKFYHNTNFYYNCKDYPYFSNANNKFYIRPQKSRKNNKFLEIKLQLNDNNLTKLYELLRKLKQYPNFNISKNYAGFNQIILKCKNQKVYNAVRKASKSWINYRIKPAYYQKIIEADRISLKNFICRKKENNELSNSPRLNENLTPLSGIYKIAKCKPDGNCMFRAVAIHILQNQSKHYIIRNTVVDYIAKNKDYFSEFIDDNFENYIGKLSQNGFWGGDVELQAIGEIYAKRIEIYRTDSASKNFVLSKSFHESISGVGEPIKLFFCDGHYDAIVQNQYNFRKRKYENRAVYYSYKGKDFRYRKVPFRF